MTKIREKLNIDIKKIEEMDKNVEAQVADILTKVADECDEMVKYAAQKANEVISSYGAKVIIKHDIKYNIVEKILKTKK